MKAMNARPQSRPAIAHFSFLILPDSSQPRSSPRSRAISCYSHVQDVADSSGVAVVMNALLTFNVHANKLRSTTLPRTYGRSHSSRIRYRHCDSS